MYIIEIDKKTPSCFHNVIESKLQDTLDKFRKKYPTPSSGKIKAVFKYNGVETLTHNHVSIKGDIDIYENAKHKESCCGYRVFYDGIIPESVRREF